MENRGKIGINKAIHQDLAQGRWQQMSLMEQLANVGSEFGRALKSKQAQNEARFESALVRMLDLLYLTLSDPRWSLPRKREIARLKETILEGFFDPSVPFQSLNSLEKYFFYCTVARKPKMK